jgi:hypothetical protein
MEYYEIGFYPIIVSYNVEFSIAFIELSIPFRVIPTSFIAFPQIALICRFMAQLPLSLAANSYLTFTFTQWCSQYMTQTYHCPPRVYSIGTTFSASSRCSVLSSIRIFPTLHSLFYPSKQSMIQIMTLMSRGQRIGGGNRRIPPIVLTELWQSSGEGRKEKKIMKKWSAGLLESPVLETYFVFGEFWPSSWT